VAKKPIIIFSSSLDPISSSFVAISQKGRSKIVKPGAGELSSGVAKAE
jgi:hypothetical protein